MSEQSKGSKSYREIESVKAYRRLMQGYYLMATHPRWFGKKLAWITSGGPVEPLYAMGVLPFYPENYGAMCGAGREAVSLCEMAESQGYSRDLCSYARLDIGSSISGRVPWGSCPNLTSWSAPTIFAGRSSNGMKSRPGNSKCPFFSWTPLLSIRRLTDHALQYVRRQMEEYIAFLEKICRRPFPEKRFLKGRRQIR